jgi:hypothetical protein
LYGIVMAERLYLTIFHEEPRFSSGFSESELCEIVESNTQLDGEQKTKALAYFQRVDAVYQTLMDKSNC